MTKRNWLDELLDRVLKTQDSLISLVPVEKRWLGKGRKARLVIKGEPSSVRYLKWNGEKLVEDDSPTGCTNTVEMHVDSLLDVLLQLKDIRGCLASGEILVTGDRTLYHEEEWAQMLDKFQSQIRLEFGSIKDAVS